MNRSLYGWLAAEGVSLVGTRVSMVALPFYVLTTTGSPEKTGLVALAEMLPLVVLKVLGGPVIDRVGTRRVALFCDWSSVLVVGAIPLLYEADALSFPAFLGLVAVAGGLRGPGDAAKHAMTPTLAATAG
ncbi:MAG TPA: MFS transporter, partial [Nocardioides sp.]|nr:MFS transporter [Nocardioides sp.]